MCTTLIGSGDGWEQGDAAAGADLQYKNVRPDYVDRLWNLVNWADVQARYAAATANPAA